MANFFVSDNLFYPTGTTFLDTHGMAFTAASAMDVNIFSFFAEGSTPPGNAHFDEALALKIGTPRD
jgi:hypothetical protein